jgi:hypothetical protein
MDNWDERGLWPVSELVGGLADVIGQVGGPEQGMALTVEQLRVQLPVELMVESCSDGTLSVLATAPERTGTSFAPTLHNLSIRVVRQDD